LKADGRSLGKETVEPTVRLERQVERRVGEEAEHATVCLNIGPGRTDVEPRDLDIVPIDLRFQDQVLNEERRRSHLNPGLVDCERPSDGIRGRLEVGVETGHRGLHTGSSQRCIANLYLLNAERDRNRH